jgi:Tfp pilus assembly protein PilV
MCISPLTRHGAARRGRGTLADEGGSFLIEAMVSALLVLIISTGVLTMMDRGSELNGQQKSIATAGNLAQSEQETLRGYSTSKEGLQYLSNLRRTVSPAPVVGNVTYTVVSRTDWINDTDGSPSCTSNAGADYMKLTTTVTAPSFSHRKPVVLETLISPSARTFDANQGSLAVLVTGATSQPISGLTLDLTGPKTLSDSTSDTGCILWGYLPAGGGYTISGSRAGWVQPSGAAAIAAPASVVGDSTTNVNLEYDQAGAIGVNFTTKLTSTGAAINTAPGKAFVESSHAAFVNKAFPVTGSALNTGVVLYPFTDPYTIYAGECSTSKPPLAANYASVVAPPGGSSAVATVQIPALNMTVKNGATLVNGIAKVTSPCGSTTYTRTLSSGTLADPGFPYGSLQNVCVQDTAGTRHKSVGTVANTTYPATSASYDISSAAGGGTTGPCP